MLNNEIRYKNTERHFKKFSGNYYQRCINNAVARINEDPNLYEVLAFFMKREDGFNVACYVSNEFKIRTEIEVFNGTYGEYVKMKERIHNLICSNVII